MRDAASLTLFTVPQPFTGHSGLIQRNALKSWTLLEPRPEIILLGDEEGTPQTAAWLGLRHEPDLVLNWLGTPQVDDIFRKGLLLGRGNIFAYVNTDIILGQDFICAIHAAANRFSSFLMTGRRIDLTILDPIDFHNPEWSNELAETAARKGFPHSQTGMDYFIFTHDIYQTEIPPFALGRTYWDTWLFDHAKKTCDAVIDASGMVLAIHQQHAYASRNGGGYENAWKGEEAKRNRRLAGKLKYRTCADADYRLLADGGFAAGEPETPFFKLETWREKRIAWLLEQTKIFLEKNMPDAALSMFLETGDRGFAKKLADI